MKIARRPLQPLSRFHFGEFKIDVNVALSTTSSIAHSDTLFSALVNSYSYIDDSGKIIEEFRESRLNISSLFYYLKREDNLVLFLPKPVFLEKDSKIDGFHKLPNKIEFVSLSAWQQGFKQDQWTTDEYKIIQNRFLLLKSEYDNLIRGTNILELKIFNIVQSPKSPIRKNSSDDSIFYQTDIEIADNGIDNLETGFFFLYNAEKDAEVMLKDATNIMAKSGIGGERNNMGRIMPDPVFGDFNPGIHSYMYSNISVISPKDLNDFAKIKWYKTFIRGGRKLNNGNQYKTVRMIKEGADVSMDTEGQMVEIGIDDNNNMALRYGKAFLIPYKNEK